MARFDESSRKIVVRIVYDGAVRAGKSTNLRELCRSLTPVRRGELVVPEELAGRTLFFDWLRIEGGVVGGQQLRCHFVTVPGQAVLSRRRRFLLREADAVVFVCDSTEKGVLIGRELLDSLRESFRAAGLEEPPLLLQANKQDLSSALHPKEVLVRLGLTSRVPVVPASAETGTGVRETAVLAIRAAARRIERQLLARGLDSFERNAETAESLHEAMLEIERQTPLSPLEALRVSEQDPVSQAAETLEEDAEPIEPPLPLPNTPSGTIWPTPQGREILRELSRERIRKREDLVARPGAENGSGRSDGLLYQAGPWCLKTSRRRRYADPADARSALLGLVRAKISLGELRPRRTVLGLGAEPHGPMWLWTVTPWLRTLRSEMVDADEASDEESLGKALSEFARTAVTSLALAARENVSLDVHPSNFARDEDRVVYLDDDIGRGETIPAIGYNLLQRVEEYSHRPRAIETYLAAIEEAVPRSLSRDEAERLGLEPAIEQAVVRSAPARRAQSRLKAVASRAAFAAKGA